MKLNRQQRHMAYMIMLAEAEEVLERVSRHEDIQHFAGGVAAGLCDMVENIIEEELYKEGVFNHFGLVELLDKKPQNKEVYWFDNDTDGWQMRIYLLKQCITETADAWPK